ncbi:hypothetical protein [Rhodanobacter sp. A1T4]|uniref:hypothetical protein n=1 Tax=Rhodanobacter sp. A1T4 TaxID=2723087 RepID=UPI001618D0C8|nr:hypothetical protein [Rhodanobacter sp. A1T4]MBB6245689.1 hypothetical protein [Rhodanobacter sp. A1T4]
MGDHLEIMRRVGKVLIVVGLIDICFMVYCLANGKGYSSSLNIFALVAGIFLWRGSMRAARLVTRYSAFGLAGGLGLCLLLVPFMRPAGLWLAEFRLSPLVTLASIAMMVVMLGLLLWTYREMRSPAVVAGLVAASEDSAVPVRYFVIGALIPLFIAVIFHFTLHGDIGAKAIELAKAKYGDSYQYSPTSFSEAGSHASVTLDAYNSHEIKSVTVGW